MAFQIADDVLDVIGSDDVLGKPAGSDYRNGVMTLPIILFAADLASESPLRTTIERGDGVLKVIEAVRDSDAPERALSCARMYSDRAIRALERFPASEARDALSQLALQVIDRSS